ncbi:MAG: protease inhibitor I42 family protein [Christensenellales bacterium]
MKKTFCLLLMVLLLVSVSAGCKNAVAEKIYGEGETKISAKAGEKFTIRLPENPTTGYAWSVKISDETVVKLDKDDYEATPTDTVIVGSGGQRVLTFAALSKGTAAITLAYERSFEKDSAIETIIFDVTVN